jgi:hypothetical protein
MSLWKTWSNVWDKIVVVEGLTRTWPRWTMHQRRASWGLGIDEPYVIEKGKWIFNLRNQAYYEESYITSQSLLNQEVKWLGYQKWKLIILYEVLQVTTSKGSMPKQNQMWHLSWSQKEMKWQDSILMQAQVEGVDFIFNLEYSLSLYQEGYHMNCQQSPNAHIAQKPKWDEWNTKASYTTHLAELGKIRQSSFSNRSV